MLTVNALQRLSTKMLNMPEVGYTPANLTALLHNAGLNFIQAADLLGVSYRTFQNWTYGIDNKNHRDMPLSKWIELLVLTENA